MSSRMQAAVLVLLLGVSLCGVRGADDQSSPDLLSVVTKLQSEVQTLKTSLAQLQSGPRVAFFATFRPEPFEGLLSKLNGTIRYNRVTTNEGHGYNAETGVFTAPVRGLYVFHFTGFTKLLLPPFGPVLKKNSAAEPGVELHKADLNDLATRVAVVTLEEGDVVFVELPMEAAVVIDPNTQPNSFSGFLLSPM